MSIYIGDSKFYERVAADNDTTTTTAFLNDSDNYSTSPTGVLTPITWFETKRLDSLEELKKKSSVKVGVIIIVFLLIFVVFLFFYLIFLLFF